MPPQDPEPDFVPADPWQVVSHLIAGVLLFGVLGWLADRWLGTNFLVAVGIVLGAALAIYMIWCRLNAATEAASSSKTRHARHDPPRHGTTER